MQSVIPKKYGGVLFSYHDEGVKTREQLFLWHVANCLAFLQPKIPTDQQSDLISLASRQMDRYKAKWKLTIPEKLSFWTPATSI